MHSRPENEKAEEISDIIPKSTRLIENQFASDFASSVAAGTVIAYTAFPAEGYKKYLQSGQTGRFHPYRGSGIFALNIVPTTTVQLATDKYLKSYMSADASPLQKLAASFYCGVQGAMFATVIENCVLQQQLKKTSPIVAMQNMLQQGVLRPWKSYSMIATRDGIFAAYMLSGGEQSAEYFNKNFSARTAFAASFGVSVLGTALSHPFDMIGTYMQKTDAKMTVAQAAKNIFKDYGYKGFYRGFLSRVVMFYAFGNVIPFVKNHLDEYIKDPVKKVADAKQDFSVYSNSVKTFFSRSKAEPEKPGPVANEDYVDLRSFKK